MGRPRNRSTDWRGLPSISTHRTQRCRSQDARPRGAGDRRAAGNAGQEAGSPVACGRSGRARQNRCRRLRQGRSPRRPGPNGRARQGLRQTAAPDRGYRRARAPHHRRRHRRSLYTGATAKPQSGDRGQPAAAQAEGHPVERDDRGRVRGRRQAGAGGIPRGHPGGSAPQVTGLVDSHCHLDDSKFDADREQVIERALAAGVERLMAIGTGDGPADLRTAIRQAEQYPFIFATIGVHPHDASKATPETFAELRDLAGHPKVLAVGEIGLDYHYDFSPREVQRAVFEKQLEVAAESGHPIVIHTREAWADTLAILRERWRGAGIMHCFTGDEEQAREALALGFHLSFGGVLTFPKAESVRQAAKITPEGRLLVETDCPYLAPVPHRGKRNEPSFVVETARRLAEVRGTTLETIAAS